MRNIRIIGLETYNNKMLSHLQKAFGLGAMIIDWNDIDYDIGRGIIEGNDRCIWNKDGRRIDIMLGAVHILLQTKKPCLLYGKLKELYPRPIVEKVIFDQPIDINE